MKNIIIGTAGHIDHGKTSLIKALTGRETDRLEEEKRRGITIDLGFTYFDLPNGDKAGIIDVPGHEKFIKNMLAGVGGMDLVLMVIAADEGIMPQTREHLDILSTLNMKQGIVVLTKKDRVEQDWLEMVEEEVREEIQDSFLKNAPMIAVSSVNGEGIEELKNAIMEMAEMTIPKSDALPFRLFIDRVFTIDGFGTVVTGTQVEGSLRIDDELMLYPGSQSVKIRNIQVHGEGVQASYAGQRVALNLGSIKKEDIQRGNVLAKKDSLEETGMIDVKLELLKSTAREIPNRTRLRLYHGTSETLCRVILLNKEELKAGESCYAQLRLEEKITIKKGDYFVTRFYSPMETIGGGLVLDPNPSKHKQFDEEVLSELTLLETGSAKDILASFIKKYGLSFTSLDNLADQLGQDKKQIREYAQQLMDEKKIIMLTKEWYVHHKVMAAIEENLEEILMAYHQQNPLKAGMSLEECRTRLFKEKNKWTDDLLKYFAGQGKIRLDNQTVALADFEVSYTAEQIKMKTQLEDMYYQHQFTVPMISEWIKTFKNQQEILQILQDLIQEGILIRIDADICLHRFYYDKAVRELQDFIKANKAITLAEFRDLLGTSRKYAMPLLDYFDQEKITKKLEDTRVLFAT